MSLIKIPDKGFFWRISEEINYNYDDPVAGYFNKYPAYEESFDKIIDTIYNNSDLTKTEIFNKIIEFINSEDLEFIFID